MRCSGLSRSISRSACSGGQLGQERGPVVRRHLVENGCRLGFRERFQHAQLGIEIEVGEGLGGPFRLEQPKDADLLGGRQRIDQLGEVGGKPAVDDLVERVIITGLDQFANRG